MSHYSTKFNHVHYVPVLKAKRGEFSAIEQLKSSTRVTPLFEATILAQLRYSTPNEFIVWKGHNAFEHQDGFGQFIDICKDLIKQPEYRGAQFSFGDQEIQEKATIGGSSGNAETWRKIGTSHHLETVLDQLANLP